MSKRPFYTALGYIVWKTSKFTVKHKAKNAIGTPELLVGVVVLAGLVAGGAAVAATGDDDA
ncbi:MAG: hypothetical protein JHD16_19160 [Solirubrobacteraceae bacterium]|nr:hypothetical protein [Solirubrobacteraceae bacterium]